MKIISHSEEETISAGEEIAKKLSAGDVILLTGDLGAGKTRFVRGIAKSMGIKNWERVRSPTFTFRQTYYGESPLYHFDFYRIKDIDDLSTIGIDPEELVDGVTAIERGEKFLKLLENFFEKKIYIIKIKILSEGTREIEINQAGGE